MLGRFVFPEEEKALVPGFKDQVDFIKAKDFFRIMKIRYLFKKAFIF